MFKGTLLGFGGATITHHRATPPGLENATAIKRNDLLPVECGTRLELYELYAEEDPFVLYDRWGNVLYVWPEDYTPSFTEVHEVCQQFL